MIILLFACQPNWQDPQDWSGEFKFDSSNQSLVDSDNDGLSDQEELELGTNPLEEDSDEDGISDGDEVEQGLDPTNSDSDEDGISDGEEIEIGTDPTNSDSDNDGASDGEEIEQNTDPNDVDSDNDGIWDGAELEQGTDPNSQDNENNTPSEEDENNSPTPDPSSEPSTELPQSLMPLLEGRWYLGEASIYSETCNYNSWSPLLNIFDQLPESFNVANSTAEAFTLELLGETIECIRNGSYFECTPYSTSLPVPNFDASGTIDFVYSGNVMSETEMVLSLNLQVVSCDGADCSALNFLVPYPCFILMNAPATF